MYCTLRGGHKFDELVTTAVRIAFHASVDVRFRHGGRSYAVRLEFVQECWFAVLYSNDVREARFTLSAGNVPVIHQLLVSG